MADDAPYKVEIRLAWWKESVLTVKPANALRLFSVTGQILRSKRASALKCKKSSVYGSTHCYCDGWLCPSFSTLSVSSNIRGLLFILSEGYQTQWLRSCPPRWKSFHSCVNTWNYPCHRVFTFRTRVLQEQAFSILIFRLVKRGSSRTMYHKQEREKLVFRAYD